MCLKLKYLRKGIFLFNDTLKTFYLRLLMYQTCGKGLLSERDTLCYHYLGYYFWLATSILLYPPSNRQESTYNGLCYTTQIVREETCWYHNMGYSLQLATFYRQENTWHGFWYTRCGALAGMGNSSMGR